MYIKGGKSPSMIILSKILCLSFTHRMSYTVFLYSEFIILSSRRKGNNYRIRQFKVNPTKRVAESDGALMRASSDSVSHQGRSQKSRVRLAVRKSEYSIKGTAGTRSRMEGRREMAFGIGEWSSVGRD